MFYTIVHEVKDMKKFLCLATGLMMVSGCTSNQDSAASCVLDNSSTHTEILMEAHKDQMVSQTITLDSYYRKEGLQKSYAEKSAKQRSREYADVKGITFTYKIDDQKLTQKLTFDFTQVKDSDLVAFDYLTKKNDENYFSINKAVEEYEEQGYQCHSV